MSSISEALKGLLQVKYIIKYIISHYSQNFFFSGVEHSSNLWCEDLCEILLFNEKNTVLVLLKFSVP